MYYRTCHLCGEVLDPGEKCDCQEREKQLLVIWQRRTRTGKNGQEEFEFEVETV